jgi:hypothetical protein
MEIRPAELTRQEVDQILDLDGHLSVYFNEEIELVGGWGPENRISRLELAAFLLDSFPPCRQKFFSRIVKWLRT